jgi:hypothetical protein
MIARTAVPTLQTGIRTQLHHPERGNRAGIGMPMPARTYKRVYKLGKVLFFLLGRCTKRGKQGQVK